ncbi:hypothetical protein ABZ671_02240 [Micromonospora sp. NPDC006766]|uniref:hypothetical protein n=1 Tax=Micromonospora sp. NPDC006766 TaxID=3154778 RepID=UPI0033D59E9C
MRRKLIARLMVAVLGAAFVVVSSPGAGVAIPPAPEPPVYENEVGLGIEAFDEMVVDSAHGRLFFSLGRGRSGLRLTDLSGGSQRTIPGLPGASGMLLSPDGSTLYVALADADAIAALDTKTLTETRRHSIGAGTCPTRLARAGGKIYFGYGCTAPGFKLGSLDVSGPTPVIALNLPLDDGYTAPPLLRSTSGNPDLLLAVDQSGIKSTGGPTRLTLFDVSSGAPAKVESDESWQECLGLQNAALTPDGRKLILACSNVRQPGDSDVFASYHLAYWTADLSPAGRYHSDRSPVAVTTSRDGAFVVLGAGAVDSASTIGVRRTDGTSVRTYELRSAVRLHRHGLAVGAGNNMLYAVVTDRSGRNPILLLLPDFTRRESSVELYAPATGQSRTLALSGWLTFPSDGLSSPQTLHVSRRDASGTHALSDVTTEANGRYSLTDTPTHSGNNTYTVTYPGSGTHAPASRSATVWMTGATSALTLSTPSTGARAAKLTISGTLTFSGAPGSPPWTLHVMRKDDTGSRTLPAVTTTATGEFSFTDTPLVGGSNTYTVTFAGDTFVDGSSRSATVRISHDPATLRLTTKADPKNWAPPVTVTAFLGTTYTNRQVCLYAQSYGEGRMTLKCGTVNSSGNLTATHLIHKRTTFTATFAGDHRYAPATATQVVTTPAKVDVALVSPAVKRSGKYRVFQRKANPVTKSWVTPNNKGTCMYYTVQAYKSGKWRTVSTSKCLKLNSASVGKYTYTGKRTVGVPYRVRAKFGGSTANLATYSYWEYFKFRN